MPGMDGPDLAAEYRRCWPALSVIILTTFDDATIIQHSLAAGAAGFLLKDISPPYSPRLSPLPTMAAPMWISG